MYNFKHRKILSLAYIGLFFLQDKVTATENFSPIFSYDCPEKSIGLHVKGIVKDWSIEEIKEKHIAFHQDLFSNPEIMQSFADGQTRDRAATKQRCENSLYERFGKGQPHGLMVVLSPQDHNSFMHLIAGGGDRAGTSEIAYAMLPDFQGKGIATQVVGWLVDQWGPEVRRIGLGIGLNQDLHASIINKFQCFGNKTLDQFDATASPSNVASWKVLDKRDFKAAKYNLISEDIIANLEDKEIEGIRKEQYQNMEKELLKLFDINSTSTPIEAGKRYRIMDINGKKRTFSKHTRWDRLKYHFEREVN